MDSNTSPGGWTLETPHDDPLALLVIDDPRTGQTCIAEMIVSPADRTVSLLTHPRHAGSHRSEGEYSIPLPEWIDAEALSGAILHGDFDTALDESDDIEPLLEHCRLPEEAGLYEASDWVNGIEVSADTSDEQLEQIAARDAETRARCVRIVGEASILDALQDNRDALREAAAE